MQQPILQNVAKHISLTDDETDLFISLITTQNVPKKTLILREGQSCQYIYYVNAGAVRSYCIDKNAKESTIMFAMQDWWVTDMYCFVNERPAMMFMETIGDSELVQLSKHNLDKLYKHIPKFERFFRILMQNAYTREQLRIIENLSLTADERYDSFLKKYPHIAGKVTQKQIASYLGITPEFLSAVRKEKLKAKS